MPRQVRIEYPGAYFHVMARGNWRESIVFDDTDRNTFLRTLGEACARAGFLVHAFVLMTKHNVNNFGPLNGSPSPKKSLEILKKVTMITL